MNEQKTVNLLENQSIFENLLKSLNIEGANINGLIQFLNNSGFYKSPASTQYANSFPGGLCKHCLEVYQVMKELTKNTIYNQDTVLLISLFHDLWKIKYYDEYAKNVKVYSETGSKYDELGKFDWKSITSYKVADDENRFIFGDKGFNNVMLLSRYLPLTEEEMVILNNYDCGMNNKGTNPDIYSIMKRYPLVIYLHFADLKCTYEE